MEQEGTSKEKDFFQSSKWAEEKKEMGDCLLGGAEKGIYVTVKKRGDG